jgi:manganese transport protein
MDPGNWATSLAGGSKFGYALLSIALLSNIMAIILQALCAARHRHAPRPRASLPRRLSALGVVPAMGPRRARHLRDRLAEVIGTAIGLNLCSAFRSRSA